VFIEVFNSKSLTKLACLIPIILLLGYIFKFLYFIFIILVFLVRNLNFINNIMYSNNDQCLILNFKAFLVSLIKSFIFFGLFDLVDKGSDFMSSNGGMSGSDPSNSNSNNSDDQQEPNNPQPNNPQPNNPQINGFHPDIDDTIIEKCQDRMADSELDQDTNIFNNSGKSHDFTESEKDYIVNTINKDIMGDDEDGTSCFRKTEDTDLYLLTESGQNANIGDCIQRGSEDINKFSSVKNDSSTLDEIIETIEANRGR
jgi:hypothetical protein